MLAKSLLAFKEKAAEISLNRFVRKPQIINPDWKIEPEELKAITIHLPTKYEWDSAKKWVEQLFYTFRRMVNVKYVDIPQPFKGTVMFQFVMNGKVHDVAVIYSDYPQIIEEGVKDLPLCFKMQFLRGGYGLDTIVAGGYVPDSRKLYFYLPKLRSLRDRKEFAFDVYGRFSLEFAKETRRKAIEILQAQKEFKFEGSLTKVGYIDFLKETARAKICIDLPGEGDFCYRLVNYFAIGACVIGPRHRTDLHVPLVDKKQMAFCKDDFSDLVDLCKFYLENEEEREKMCIESREYFEKYLHKDNLANYYLRTCIDKLK